MGWICPVCGKVFSDQEASQHGYLCPTCSVNLQPYRIGVKTMGIKVKGKAGTYELQAQVGLGGQASVWEAKSGNRVFVLKFVDKKAGGNILGIYNQIKGTPRTVPLLDWGNFPPNEIFLVFPYFPLGYLKRNLFLKGGSLDWSLLRSFLVQMSTALEGIHAKGVVHRDVKPENIMVEKAEGGYNFYLGDFGIATVHSVTTVNLTPAYSPPELVVFLGKEQNVRSQVNHKIDWWSLGVVLLWLINKNPFQANIPAVVVSRIRNFDRDGYINSLSIPSQWKLLLRGLLTKNPLGRWDASQVKAWLSGATNIPVSLQSASFTAINFMGYTFYSYEDFASFVWKEDWQKVKEELFVQGNIFSILSNAPSQLRADVSGILNSNFSQDKKLSLILWRMNPSLPFGFKGRDFPHWASLRDFLLNPDDSSFLEELKRERLFSSYFSLMGGGNIYGLKIDGAKLQEIERWEKGNFSSLSLALLLDNHMRKKYMEGLKARLEEIESNYIKAPEVRDWLKRKGLFLSKLSSVLDLSAIEDLTKTEDELKEFVSRNLILRKSDASKEVRKRVSEIKGLAENYVPVNGKGEKWLKKAEELVRKFSQFSPTWKKWRFFHREYEDLRSVNEESLFISREKFKERLENSISKAEEAISKKIPLNEEAEKLLADLKSNLSQIKGIVDLQKWGLDHYKALVRLEELLSQAESAYLKDREEIRRELGEIRPKLSRWLSQKYWPPEERKIRNRIKGFQKRSVSSLADDELRDYYNFFFLEGILGKVEKLPDKLKLSLFNQLVFRFLMALSVPLFGFLSLVVITSPWAVKAPEQLNWLYIPYSFASITYPLFTFLFKRAYNFGILLLRLTVSAMVSFFLGFLFSFLLLKEIPTFLIFPLGAAILFPLFSIVGRHFKKRKGLMALWGALVLLAGVNLAFSLSFLKKYYPFDNVLQSHSLSYFYGGAVIAPAIFLIFLYLLVSRFRIASLGMLLAWAGYCFFRDSWIFPALLVAGVLLALFSKPEAYIEIGG